MRLSARERQLLQALGALAAIWLAIQIASSVWSWIGAFAEVILVFVVAWAFAYLIAPIVRWLDAQTRLNRGGAVAIVYVCLAVVLASVLATVIPGLASQLAALAERGPEYGQRAGEMVTETQAAFKRAGIPVDVEQLYGSLPERFGTLAASIAGDALEYVTRAAGLLFDILLVLIIAFIMLIDGGALWSRFLRALSDELRSEAELFRASTDRAFGGFIRGSLLVGVIYGLITLATLAALAVPFSGILALVAGLASIIPFFGPIIAIVPIAIITLLGAPDRLLLVLLITAAAQQVMFNVVAPRILSSSVGLHPLFVFAALLVGSRLGGFWGVFLALPVAGVAGIFLRYWYELARGRRARTEALDLIAGGERPAT